MNPDTGRPPIIETDIPARLDALPWGRFHTLGFFEIRPLDEAMTARAKARP